MHRSRRLGVVVLASSLAVAGAALGTRDSGRPLRALPAEAFSVLALGDTGRPPHWLAASSGQLAVARGIEVVDRRRPIDALVLLGDNFYYRGLTERDLLDRIRGNLVDPYCRFLALTAPRSTEVEGACAVPASERRPVPVLAVLGNHDVKSEQSARLQAEEIPDFIANWRLPSALAETVDLAPGVSLILVDSNRLIAQADPAPLRDAIRRAEGPWRVLVAHHPIGTSQDDGYSLASGFGDYGELVRRAVAEAGVPVPLMLAAHEHNLQLLELPQPGPALEVVAGGGARAFPVASSSEARRFAMASLGFARVDFPERPSERAIVSLFATSKTRALLSLPPERVARWSVDLSGDVRDEGVAEKRAQQRRAGARGRGSRDRAQAWSMR